MNAKRIYDKVEDRAKSLLLQPDPKVTLVPHNVTDGHDVAPKVSPRLLPGGLVSFGKDGVSVG